MTPSVENAGKPCVLIVDDEIDIRETLQEVVEMAGCRALLAANGAEALEVLANNRPCLIILDLLMPVMTGGELLDRMRSVPELASLSVIVSTSAPSRAPAGVPLLPKPIDIHKVWDWMKQSCACATTAPSR